MPVKYNVRNNFLTDPPSFSCQTTAQQDLGIDEIAKEINSMNPVISVDVAKTVLLNFRTVTLNSVADGNFVTLNRFVSFSPRIPKRLAEPTDTVSSSDVKVAAKIPPEFNFDIQQIATLERLGYPTKSPNIVLVKDTMTSFSRYVNDDHPVLISGENVGAFDPSSPEQGVFLIDADGAEVRQTKYGLNDPSKVIFTADFGDEWPASPNVEFTLQVRNKYTENGTLRVGNYQYCRSLNTINSSNDYLFAAGDDSTGPVASAAAPSEDIACRVQAKHKSDGTLTLAVGPMDGPLSDDQTIPEAGGTLTFTKDQTGLADDLTFGVINATDYANLLAFLDLRGRNVFEYCYIEAEGV